MDAVGSELLDAQVAQLVFVMDLGKWPTVEPRSSVMQTMGDTDAKLPHNLLRVVADSSSHASIVFIITDVTKGDFEP